MYPRGIAPSNRFRVEQFIPYWEKLGVTLAYYAYYSLDEYKIIHRNGHFAAKVLYTLFGYIRQVVNAVIAAKHDAVFIQRSAAPVGPPVLEWFIVNVFRKPIIYDFDDAIWIKDPSTPSGLEILKSYSQVEKLCKWAKVAIGGNAYLANYASNFSKKVRLIPTVVDTQGRYLPRKAQSKSDTVVVGWTGSHSTLKYLLIVKDVLTKLIGHHQIAIKIIANKRPDFNGLDYSFATWNESTEIEELQTIDIGIMPLYEDPWSEGKCGFKAIQFMALGIPVVASPVGMNKELIDEGINGYLAQTDEEWFQMLSQLILDDDLRYTMGQLARSKVVNNYSIQSVLPQWKELFESL